MFNLKSTIYQAGWLDLVFEHRNKEYGAYELRANSDKRLMYSLFIMSSIVVLLFSSTLFYQYLNVSSSSIVVVPIDKPEEVITVFYLPKRENREVQVSEPVSKKHSATKVKVTSFANIAVVKRAVIEEPPTIKQLQTSEIGSQSIQGVKTIDNGDGLLKKLGGKTEGVGGDSEPVTPDLLEKYPEFPGGSNAFSNFLRKHLKYPQRAADAAAGGKVYLSFVIEKDGHLTDIKVLRGIGYGCDEEATRVLKKSPPWSPGIQNNTNVRVLYTIPIVFQSVE